MGRLIKFFALFVLDEFLKEDVVLFQCTSGDLAIQISRYTPYMTKLAVDNLYGAHYIFKDNANNSKSNRYYTNITY